jgi:NADH:ubiquinone oxidoreductase subunit 4 (subunit M)
VMAPLLAGIVWLGLYPKPVLDRMEAATMRFLQVSGQLQATPGHTRLGATVEVRP